MLSIGPFLCLADSERARISSANGTQVGGQDTDSWPTPGNLGTTGSHIGNDGLGSNPETQLVGQALGLYGCLLGPDNG